MYIRNITEKSLKNYLLKTYKVILCNVLFFDKSINKIIENASCTRYITDVILYNNVDGYP